MPDYSNSKRAKQASSEPIEDKKIERITSAEVVIRKRGPWRTFRDLIIEADMGSVGRYLWIDFLIPTLKMMIVGTAEQGINRMVYGEPRSAGFRPRMNPSSSLGLGANRPGVSNYVPYEALSRQQHQAQLGPGPKVITDDRGYIISSRTEAEEVLDTLAMVIDKYEVVTVADLHEMLGLSSTMIDHRWGWIDVREAQIRQIRDGWVLELPQPEEIPTH